MHYRIKVRQNECAKEHSAFIIGSWSVVPATVPLLCMSNGSHNIIYPAQFLIYASRTKKKTLFFCTVVTIAKGDLRSWPLIILNMFMGVYMIPGAYGCEVFPKGRNWRGWYLPAKISELYT